ncbi:MAG TPA: chitin disaccharide deacetylase [Providencia sp.]|uniref:chitin disaccharide deacetylase n=1 Tax=Providencia sp. TaxID=589 RepID=UPI000E82F438|nr:chitin disaccharide deacetylase [Providencia sp.]MBP6080000.1 chitin disaccharide deacetylase [Providencia sp.]HBO23295.1 chitin disaccharide deacetylase [Providencia sp.]
MTSLLIVNADDFGLCQAVNYGIIESHRNGIVHSTSAMVNMPGIFHAAKLSHEYPTLAVGMHFVLTAGTPLSSIPSLTREGMLGKWLWEIDSSELALGEIEQELHRQYDYFVQVFGRKPSHIDSHHHVHMLAGIFPIVVNFAQEKGIALRVDRQLEKNWPPMSYSVTSTDYFSSDFYGDEITESLFLKILDESKQRGDSSIEVMSHPAYIDNALLKSNYAYQRLIELDVLTSAALKAQILERGFKLGSYLDL